MGRNQANGAALWQEAKLRTKRFIMPPDVASVIGGLINFSSEEIMFAANDISDKDPARSFEAAYLGIDTGNLQAARRSRTTASGHLLPGIYPVANVADALRTNPRRLCRHIASFAGSSALMMRTGDFLAEIMPEPARAEVQDIRIGNVSKLTPLGIALVDRMLPLLDHPPVIGN